MDLDLTLDEAVEDGGEAKSSSCQRGRQATQSNYLRKYITSTFDTTTTVIINFISNHSDYYFQHTLIHAG